MFHTSSTFKRPALSLAVLCALFFAGCSSQPNPVTQSGSLLSASGSALSSGASSASDQAILTLSWNTPNPLPGQTVIFTITLHNITGETLTGVHVDVTFPSDKEAVTETSGGIINDDRISWSLASFAPDQVKVYTYKAVVNAGLTSGAKIQTSVTMSATNIAAPLAGMSELTVGAEGASSFTSSASSQALSSFASSPAGLPYFYGAQSSAGASSVAMASQLSVTEVSDLSEADPGHRVHFTITVRSTSFSPLQELAVIATLPLQQVQIADAGAGTVFGNRIQWTISSLPALQSRTFSYDVTLLPSLHQGDTVRTAVAVSVGGVTAQMVAGAVHVIGHLPETGADDRFFAPIDDGKQDLSPYVP